MKLRNWKETIPVAVLSVLLMPAAYGQPYSEVYVFGESFVDMGNAKDLFSTYSIIFPPSPPYAGGRFCNGPVFPEVIAENFEVGPLDASYAGGTNYAYGGARSVETNLMWGFIPIPSVQTQVAAFLSDTDTFGKADPDALYILHDGGNDTAVAVEVFFATEEWDLAAAVMEESALGMIESVQMLVEAGAVNIVVPGAPFFSDSAWLCGLSVADALGDTYNAILEAGLSSLDGDLRILYFDLFGFETAVADHFITDCNYCVDWFDPTAGFCSNPDDLFNWDQGHVSAAMQQLIGDAVTVAMLKDEVLHLTAAGTLKGGNSNALLAKLNGAYKKLEDRKPKTAANKVRAFANQVAAFVRKGKLSSEQAELLLTGAYGIIDQP
jgi:phospholipase/lecithinase/hemolysin